MNIGEQIAALLKREGGYVNDPTDSGGETNLGITSLTLKRAIADGIVPPDTTIKSLTPPLASTIYQTYYFWLPQFDELPEPLQPLMFDFGVNSGPAIAIRKLQKVLGLKEDGVIGKETLAKVKTIDPQALVKGVIRERVRMIANLVQKRPKDIKFLEGWLMRALDFL